MPTTAPFVIEETRIRLVRAVRPSGYMTLQFVMPHGDDLVSVPVGHVVDFFSLEEAVEAARQIGLTVHQDGHVFRARGEA